MYGFYQIGQGNQKRRVLKEEKLTARAVLIPFLQAEEDRRYVKVGECGRTRASDACSAAKLYTPGRWKNLEKNPTYAHQTFFLSHPLTRTQKNTSEGWRRVMREETPRPALVFVHSCRHSPSLVPRNCTVTRATTSRRTRRGWQWRIRSWRPWRGGRAARVHTTPRGCRPSTPWHLASPDDESAGKEKNLKWEREKKEHI